ncbi:MAG: glycosyltransferase family 9 protein [Endomicrobiaceae bacterium]|nr:glycosyltransferase family 9 protein [Endomicrobiaceae bacterium]
MKILIIKPSSFGDIIQANPVLQAIKSKWKDSLVDWLVFKQWKQVVELFPNVNNIKCWDRKGGIKAFFEVLKECNKENYDLVIDLQGLLRTAVLGRLLKAEQKIGVSGMKELSWLFLKEPYKRDRNENAVIRNLNSLSYITKEKYIPCFDIKVNKALNNILCEHGIKKDDKTVAFVPFSRGKTKTWNSDNYVALAEKIKSLNEKIKIVILGSQKDYGKIKTDNIIDLCGKTNIKELAEILSVCECAIGADTGAMHLANAIGIKNIFIFGGSDIKETAPYGNNAKVISANLSCSPCRGKCKFDIEKCLEQINPDNVFESVKEWIK